ncbi:MAG TPA: nucleoside-diphosphate kinase [candidate division Zixibacteria bacterium]|nr:nucleoside-diphosphate kinase [candidate division Zixibacteria bacterium]
MSRTLLIIKPDATERNLIGHVINRLERAGFRITEMRMTRLSADDARRFYAVHEGKPFLNDLVTFMTSGPVVPMVLEKENAVTDLRELIGATNPSNAACGTIRQEIARNVQANSVHASDSDENAVREISFFFGG